MRLLLDTHIWLWSLLEPERLAPRVAASLVSTDNELWLSPISVWEAILLADRGRLAVAGDPVHWVERMLRAGPSQEAPFTHDVAIRSTRVDLPHRDPADRFLVASAIVHELTLVTADERLVTSAGHDVMENR